ncbi:MAG: hypothetical protein JWM80_1462 [Cyanobacteria bacterium RYN_339]|nr:hypothetical protein [Cyanobacteria bacterium RYN_339]
MAVLACQGAPVPVRHAASKAPTSQADAAKASPTPAPRTLKRPAGDVRVLAGQVSVDGYYLQQALGDAVRLDGQTLVLSNNGAALISNNGGALVSDAGGGLVANNGGAVLGKMKWGLLADAPLGIGDQRRVAGIAVSVVDPSTGKPMQLGQDETGKPAYEVLTNQAGGFEVYLVGKVDASTIRVSGTVSGSKDDRLAYDVFTGNQAQQVTVDEDTALVGRFLRTIWSAQVEHMALVLSGQLPPDQQHGGFGGPGGGFGGPGGGFGGPGGGDGLFAVAADQVKAALKQAHSETWTRPQLRAVAATTSEAMLAGIDFGTLKSATSDKLAMEELREVVAIARQKTAEAMQGGKDFHDEPFLARVNAKLPTAEQYVIKRPTDLLDFCDREILASPDRTQQNTLLEVFGVIEVPPEAFGQIFAAVLTVDLAVLARIQEPGALEAIKAIILRGPQP